MIYLFLLFLQVAFAVSPVRIAVLEFRGINIEESALTLLADDVREGVLIAVKNDSTNSNYLVMTRENMMSILKEMGKGIEECTGECEVEIARNIGADYVVSGEVYLIEDQYILSLKMHDTQAGNLLGREEAKGNKITELLDETTIAATKLVSSSLDISLLSNNTETEIETETSKPSRKIKTHQITFDSTPSGASVYVDNQLICNTTPCDKFIKEGEHNVQYSLQRYANHIETIDVKEPTSFRAKLQSHFGVYTIHSAPLGLPVYENDVYLGKTPFEVDLTPGEHELEIKDDCYQKSITRVYADEGERDNVYINILERNSGIFVEAYIDDVPVKTDIYVDGKNVGKTGKQIEIPLCSKKVEIHHKNYQWTQHIDPKENKVIQLEADMRRIHKPKPTYSYRKKSGKVIVYSIVLLYYIIYYSL